MKGILLALALSGLVRCSLAELRWETIHPIPAMPGIEGLAFGNDRFVAATIEGLYFSADQGATWRQSFAAAEGLYRGVLFEKGIFVAISTAGEIATSTDGINWTVTQLAGKTGLWALTFGNGLFIITGDGGTILVSADGLNWHRTTRVTLADLWLTAFGNGLFVSVEKPEGFPALTYGVVTSTDGTNWTRAVAEIPNVDPNCIPNPRLSIVCAQFHAFTGLAFGDGRFVLNAQHGLPALGRSLVSTNGVNWTAVGPDSPEANVPLAIPPNRLFFEDGRFIYLHAPARASSDLQSWTPIILPYPPWEFPQIALQAMARGNGTYVVGGVQDRWAFLARGTDLNSLRRLGNTLRLGTFRTVAAMGQTIVAANPLSASTNAGADFQQVQSPAGDSIVALEAAQGKIVGVGVGGAVIRSTDGITWSKRLSNTARNINGVAFGNDTWVAVGQGGLALTSPDASLFSLQNSRTEVDLSAITYGDGRFLAVGNSGAILTTRNGESWTVRGTEEAKDLFGIAYGNGRFVAVGASGIVHVSTNGTDWTRAIIASVVRLTDVAFGGGTFVAIEAPGDGVYQSKGVVYESEDGFQWNARILERPVFGVDGSGGTVWAAGSSVYIASGRAVTNAQSRLSAELTTDRKLRLRFEPPRPGSYTIISSPTLTGPWSKSTVLPNLTDDGEWTDPREISGTRFYQAVPE